MAAAIEPLKVTVGGAMGEVGGRIDPKDPHYWRRIMMALVKTGYGNYSEAAQADIVEAAIVLSLQRDVFSLAHAWTAHGRKPA